MRVLSVEDIDLMITLVSSQKVLRDAGRHEQQLDKLISMGIIRPGGGVLALTELGQKTAHALLGHSLGSSQDATLADAPVDEALPLEIASQASAVVPAKAEAEAAPEADATAEAVTEAASGNDTPALETN
jgi:hypothetical protein